MKKMLFATISLFALTVFVTACSKKEEKKGVDESGNCTSQFVAEITDIENSASTMHGDYTALVNTKAKAEAFKANYNGVSCRMTVTTNASTSQQETIDVNSLMDQLIAEIDNELTSTP